MYVSVNSKCIKIKKNIGENIRVGKLQENICYRCKVLSDYILSIWVGGIYGSVHHFQKYLFNSCKDLRSNIKWKK